MKHRLCFASVIATLAIFTFSACFLILAVGDGEEQMLRIHGAHEIFSGTPYALTGEVAKAYGIRAPHIYIASNHLFNAGALPTSRAPLGIRRGKIMLSREFVDNMNSVELRGVIAHEIAHCLKGVPVRSLFSLFVEQRSIEEEEHADMCAAYAVGYPVMRTMLLAYQHMLSAGWRDHMRYRLSAVQQETLKTMAILNEKEIAQRLDALDALFGKNHTP